MNLWMNGTEYDEGNRLFFCRKSGILASENPGEFFVMMKYIEGEDSRVYVRRL